MKIKSENAGALQKFHRSKTTRHASPMPMLLQTLLNPLGHTSNTLQGGKTKKENERERGIDQKTLW